MFPGPSAALRCRRFCASRLRDSSRFLWATTATFGLDCLLCFCFLHLVLNFHADFGLRSATCSVVWRLHFSLHSTNYAMNQDSWNTKPSTEQRVDSNAQWGGIGERFDRSYARVRVYGKNPCARHAIYASARRGPLTHLVWHRLTGVDPWRAGAITGVVGWGGDMPH